MELGWRQEEEDGGDAASPTLWEQSSVTSCSLHTPG